MHNVQVTNAKQISVASHQIIPQKINMTAAIQRTIFIDPSSKAYYRDKLFDLSDPILNRDDTLAPFGRARSCLEERGIDIYTADYLLAYPSWMQCDYYSIGLLENYRGLLPRKNIRLRGFVIMEPPVTAPRLYRALPELTAAFEKVYVHNTIGDGYSLKGVDQSRLHQFCWPQPYMHVLEPYWSNSVRQRRMVVINGNHMPRSFGGELYSKRIEAMASLAKDGLVDLYGHGWGKWWSPRSMWPAYWKNRKALMSIYRGSCRSKIETLSQYHFCLCFENMAMKGYVTEKIFDCLYAGTIPLYLGAKDIEGLIPRDAYVDCRQFGSWTEMRNAVMMMGVPEIQAMREAGRDFLESRRGSDYYNSLINILQD
jgi:hypothetical protein